MAMSSDHIERLSRLSEATDALLAEARGVVDDAVNWGDLRCIDAQHVITVDGEEYDRVIISEAAPDAVHLHQFIRNGLTDRGFGGVEISTEW